MEPFSTLAFKVLVWIFATTTKICTCGGPTWVHALGFKAHRSGPPTRGVASTVVGQGEGVLPADPFLPGSRPSRASLTAGNGRVWARHSSAFRASWVGRWVVTHSLADSNFHGHCPAVCINQHLFWGLMSVGIGRLNLVLGSSRSASSAYQKWPTRHSHSTPAPRQRAGLLTHLMLENRLRSFRPQDL